MARVFGIIVSILVSASLALAEEAFDQTVAPLLARHCLECHNAALLKGGLDLSSREAAMQGGESGPALVRGRADESLLWRRVAAGEMPPDQPLDDAGQAALRQWIMSGASWGTDPIDVFRYSSPKRAGYDWWALQPVRQPTDQQPEQPGEARVEGPPAAGVSSRFPGATNAIDLFIGEKLAQHELEPSPEANRATLVRRVSFDLCGLPPHPDDVDRFTRDPSPDAYERLVDRLLASPAYGERWARHWLDVARFGESQGFERDKARPNAWRYRDWVIDALNDDLPYDEFARRQLAGDVLPASDAVATGFLVAGPYDEVGQQQQSAAMRAIVRQDELEDLVSAVGQTFLGLTVNCARCHDHKFDPIRQTEYYQLAAALAGVRHGERELADESIRDAAQRRIRDRRARLELVRDELARIEQPARGAILAERQARATVAIPPQPIARWDFDEDGRDSVGGLHASLEGPAVLRNHALEVDGQHAFAKTAPLAQNLREKTLEAWVLLPDLKQQGGGAISVQTLDGAVFDAIVFGEQEAGRWMAGSDGFRRTQSFQGPAEKEAAHRPVHFAIVYEADGTIRGYRDGQPYGQAYRSSGPVTFQAGKAHVVFGLRHAPPGGNRLLRGSIDRAQLHDRALSPEEVAASAGVVSDFVSQTELAERLSEPDRAAGRRLRFEIEQLEADVARSSTMSVYAVVAQAAEPMHRLHRGNPSDQRERVGPGGVAAVARASREFLMPPETDAAAARSELARWVTHPDNPLFPRVIANRLWHHHFGVGLVDTPNDLGFNGGRPTHPLLLDWLAGELARREYALKSLHRLLITSATYRQSTARSTKAEERDADNRLLWRHSPTRLDAESLRDAMLAVSDQLNLEMHGPGFHDFSTFVANTQFYEMLDPVGASFQRRSLYRTWIRSGRSPFLDVFDCPDPSTKTPRRATTTTPLQALAMQNNSLVLRLADGLAERVARETASVDSSRQIDWLCRLAYGRPPTDTESALMTRFADEHGLAALGRVVLNSNEFLYVD